MSLWATLGFDYLGALTVALLLRLKAPQPRVRRGAGIATILLAISGVLALAQGGFLRLAIFHEPPSLAELMSDFPTRRTDLETMLRMFNEDSNFYEIAPDFVRRADDSAVQGRTFDRDDPDAGLARARWNVYREIFSHTGVRLGIERDPQGDVFVMVDSVGLLNRGHVSGYVHCASLPGADEHRFSACGLNQDQGERKFDPQTREAAYSFQRLDGEWYAYDAGPS